MNHDFILAGKYIIIFGYPVFGVRMHEVLLGRSTVLDCLKYKPEVGTEIFVIDRTDMKVVSNAMTPADWFTWHYINGYVDEPTGNVIIDHASYPNFDSFHTFDFNNFLSKDVPPTFEAVYERLTLDPIKARVLKRETLYEDNIEFPTINDSDGGLK